MYTSDNIVKNFFHYSYVHPLAPLFVRIEEVHSSKYFRFLDSDRGINERDLNEFLEGRELS